MAPSVDPIEMADQVQTALRERLGQCWVPEAPVGFKEEEQQIADLVKRTINFGESNSVLLIGTRGIGKTMLLKNALKEVKKDKNVHQNLLEVYLSGLLQTNDKIALKEIARQLHLDNTVGDKVFGSFAENLQFLLESLKSGGQHSKPILFILDEFDLFAQHRNQTLLYNLFDIAQSAQAPITIIGVTCRFDVMELLEKRVKSRFSHRQILLFNKLSFKEYTEVFKNYLKLPKTFPDSKFVSKWNDSIEKLGQDGTIQDVLKRQYSIDKDIRRLQTFMMGPICNLSSTQPFLQVSDFIDSFKRMSTDSKSVILHGLSILELSLVIAMKHLTELYDGEPFNFEIVYNEYLRFSQQKSSLQIFEKSVVLKAFEHLQNVELIKPLDGSCTRVQKEYRPMTLLVHPMQLKEVLQKFPSCPIEVKHWATTSVI
ncbi:origin recognition complex subunit 4 isoform X1 [Octopus bimaculoides]|uniref:Origin recognition complex subunit 4 n=1 Tax=Octopus bimaculoides TaxID=37653 RepID=A0A0L8HHB6_OCTBM|nr:origin recognition complex subunit 4 isoform X1 [Octopus bimaculoides]XP_014772350.1 origin recognition complex subunit 4 isoform X1 [Octopus bimaculoides]|eukprot:XP_014772349.1 PREDICTED: origin recognition complex subunit 4-like isoform X1 [Octopus bimaculoides]